MLLLKKFFFLFLLHEVLSEELLQAQLSRVAGFEACGQSNKPQKSFAYTCRKTLEAFCLSSLLPSPLSERSHSYDILLRTREKKRWGKKPKEAHPIIGMQARLA